MIPKAQQEAEAAAREQAGISPGETAAAVEVADDTPAPAEAAAPQPAPQTVQKQDEPAPVAPPRPTPQARRDEIIARFRASRTEEINAERDDIAEFTRSGVPHEFEPAAAEAEAAVQPVPEAPEAPDVPEAPEAPEAPQAPQAAAPAAQTVKVKVIAQAQVSLAAKTILDDAKQLRSELQSLVDQRKVQRPDQPGHHAGPSEAQPELTPPASEAPNQDPYEKLVQEIQFGDPAAAKTLFGQTIQQEVARQVSQNLVAQRLQDEGVRTAKILKDFEEQHPDLANDEMARAAIERKVVAMQIDDLKALGVDPAKLSTDGRVTSDIIAEAHKYYRANGYSVRKPDVILKEATDAFMAWKGTKEPQARPGTPRVEVTTERSARRQAVPQTPGRTVAPKPTPKPAATPADRSAVVERMQAARRAPRTGAIATGGRH